MDLSRFEELIAAYGAVPDRWPAAERDAARRRLRDDPKARVVFERARGLDQALDAWTAPAVSAALQGRVLAARTARGAIWRGWWLPGAGLVGACAAGVVAGLTLIGPGLAFAFPADHVQGAGVLADGISAFGAPVDVEAGR